MPWYFIERPAITEAGPNQLPLWCPFKIQGGANRLNVQYRSPSSPSLSKQLSRPNGNLDSDPGEFQIRVHLFGGTSSPSCANFALKKTVQDNKVDFNPETIQTVEQN